jgi:hypothetical protein
MIIEEPRKMANKASLLIAIRYIHPSQTQKARTHLRIRPTQPFLLTCNAVVRQATARKARTVCDW